MGKYYVKFGLSKNFNAGSKAMKDIMVLLESRGYKPVPALPTGVNKFLKLADIPVLLFITLFGVGRKGTIVYFMPSNVQRILFMKFLRNLLGFRLICFINDIESMRMNKSKEFAANEVKGITAADVILVPNENSVQILKKEYGIANLQVAVGVWDYLVSGPSSCSEASADCSKVVAFAGNLNKSSFIKELDMIDLKFRIWGSGIEKGNEANCEFMGVESPERLVGNIAGCAWGLVWDGSSVETCSGLLGTYLRFNNSHKCGLYLAAGIPLIVWRESGMALFVEKYQVGICVSSLKEAAAIVNGMDGERYDLYRKNAQSIGELLRQGHFFLCALTMAENLVI